MAKADLGTKRACLACGMRFYDFSRSPIICPGCGAEFDPENIIKSRKGRPSAKSVARDDSDATDDDQVGDDDNADELVAGVVDDNDDDGIDFDDDDDVDVDDDGPGIIQDDISDDDELLPNLDDKDDS
jgi:uncharacterized protein (TIGR02300 family)